MSGAVTWEILMLLGTVVISTASFAIWVARAIGKIKSDLGDDISDLDKAIAAHKLYAAEHYATRESVNKELDRMSAKLDKIDDKLDRALEKQ
ncbi:hypothetical protein [Maritalea sp.]|uniref:hypothetical protein n=1 Tax=Maritalea sp. TaxID=2003361 RepID=UPI003EF55D88